MASRFSRRKLLALGILGLGTAATGCGTLMYPERRGQRRGRLDWTVVGLDAIGLVLFVVPGVIAFAVDFYNGTIYLPPGGVAKAKCSPDDLRAVHLAKGEMSQGRVEKVVSQHIDQPVRLVRGRYESESLENIDQFWTTADRLESNRAERTS